MSESGYLCCWRLISGWVAGVQADYQQHEREERKQLTRGTARLGQIHIDIKQYILMFSSEWFHPHHRAQNSVFVSGYCHINVKIKFWRRSLSHGGGRFTVGLQYSGDVFLLLCGFFKLTLWLEDTIFDFHGAMFLQSECINMIQFSCCLFYKWIPSVFCRLFLTCESGQIYVWVGFKHCCGKNKGSDKVTNPNKCNKNDSKELSACEMRCKMLKLSELSVSKWSWSVESHTMTSTYVLYWSVAHNPCLCWKMLDVGLSPALCWSPVDASLMSPISSPRTYQCWMRYICVLFKN